MSPYFTVFYGPNSTVKKIKCILCTHFMTMHHFGLRFTVADITLFEFQDYCLTYLRVILMQDHSLMESF